jgi:hypothetical protein
VAVYQGLAVVYNRQHQGLNATTTMNLGTILFSLQPFVLAASTVTEKARVADVETKAVDQTTEGVEPIIMPTVDQEQKQEPEQEDEQKQRHKDEQRRKEIDPLARPVPAPIVLAAISAECEAAIKEMNTDYCLYPSVHRLMYEATLKTRTRNVESSRNYIEAYVNNSLRGAEFNNVYWARKALRMFFTCKDVYPTGWDLWSELPMFKDEAMVLEIKKKVPDLEILQWYNSILSLRPGTPDI